jgi:hypothetical protein
MELWQNALVLTVMGVTVLLISARRFGKMTG